MFVCGLAFIACITVLLFSRFVVFFGHLTPAVEDLRYQHVYHPVPVEQKSPALARVLNEISSGLFGDRGVYEP
jgi:starch phosphorylase